MASTAGFGGDGAPGGRDRCSSAQSYHTGRSGWLGPPTRARFPRELPAGEALTTLALRNVWPWPGRAPSGLDVWLLLPGYFGDLGPARLLSTRGSSLPVRHRPVGSSF